MGKTIIQRCVEVENMNSFALWFDKGTQERDFEADIHFNLWNIHNRKAQPVSLDIGIKIYAPKGYSKVNFYIPWEVNKEDVVDLAEHLKETKMLCTVFNEDCEMTQEAQSKILHVTNTKRDLDLNIYCLDVKNDITVENKYEGSLISFVRPKQLETSDTTEYFRFRINSKGFKNIIKLYSPDNIFFQSAISITEAVDFRFNDYRSLPSSLLEEMRDSVSYQIGKVHFLLLTESYVDLQYSSIAPTARELENNIWKDYYPNMGKKNIVAYHWKFKGKKDDKLIENCIMFVKTRVSKCNWKTILLYVLAAGLISMLYDFIFSLLQGLGG